MNGYPNRVWGVLLVLFGLGAILVSFLGARESLQEADREAEARRAIQQVLDAQVSAWNRGDLEGFMTGYWQSQAMSFFSGNKKTGGWQATLDRYRQRYQADGKEMGNLTFGEIEIEMFGPDSAWVRGRWQLITSKERPGGLFTLIVKRLPEGWRIVHDHTSES